MNKDYDVAVIGAGAAGVAAARRLAEARLSVILVEAADRIGGRAHTIHHDGLPIDLGCGWLHSADRNPWAALAPALGLSIDRTPPPWRKQFRDLGFPAGEQAAAQAAYARFEAKLRETTAATDRASALLANDDPWKPYLAALSSYINGVELEGLSIRDYLAYADADTGVNWRVIEGYGSLIARAAAGLPLALNTPVSAIDAAASLLAIATPAGTLRARAAIVTVSTNVLASDAIRLPAGLDGWREAAGRLPLGLADKVIFEIDRPEDLEPDTQVLGNPHRTQTGIYHLRPFGRPFIEGFFGGNTARKLESGDAMAAFALDELSNLFGAGIRHSLRPIAQSRWAHEPFVRGSYSHAAPGHAGARAVLAQSWEDRIFFAGEACSATDFSTAHGAYRTGIDAANAILANRGSA